MKHPGIARRIGIFLADWPWHIATVLAIGAVAYLGPRQLPLLVYKAALAMIGGCGGYWIFVAFFGRDPEYGDEHDRWQTVVLMCVLMLAMSLGA